MKQRSKPYNKRRISARKRGMNMHGGASYILGRSGKTQIPSAGPGKNFFPDFFRMLFRYGGER